MDPGTSLPSLDASVPGPSMWSRFPPPRPGRPKEPAPSPMYLSMRHRGMHKTSWTQGLARSSGRRLIVQRGGLRDQARQRQHGRVAGVLVNYSAGLDPESSWVWIFTQPPSGAADSLPMRNRGRPIYVRLGRLRSRTPLADQIAAPESRSRGCSATREADRDSGYGCAVPNCSLRSVAERRRGDCSGDTAADHDLIRAGRCFRRESGGTDLSPSLDK